MSYPPAARTRKYHQKRLMGTRGLYASGFRKGGHSRTMWRRPTASRKANTALRMIRRMQNEQETKVDHGVGAQQIPIGGAWIDGGFGPYMVQGDTNLLRDGNKIMVESLTLKLTIGLSALEAIGTSVRVILVMDRRPNGANATTTQMMLVDNDINSPYAFDPAIRGRFQFIFDKTFTFGAQQTQKNIKMFIKGPFKIEYTGNAGTVADIQKNNFLLCGMANQAVAVINMNYNFIFRWKDT